MLTMKKARKQFANRTMVSSAFVDTTKKLHPRKNARNPLGSSFRQWARENVVGTVSPRLARVVNS